MQLCDVIRFRRVDKTYKTDVKRVTLNTGHSEKRQLSLEGSSLLEAERKYGHSPPPPLSSRGHGTRAPDVSAGFIPVVKQLMKAFLTDKEGTCKQNTMASLSAE